MWDNDFPEENGITWPAHPVIHRRARFKSGVARARCPAYQLDGGGGAGILPATRFEIVGEKSRLARISHKEDHPPRMGPVHTFPFNALPDAGELPGSNTLFFAPACDRRGRGAPRRWRRPAPASKETRFACRGGPGWPPGLLSPHAEGRTPCAPTVWVLGW